MIIISKHTNQLCNRLFTYLPVLSYALEANEKVCFLFQYKEYVKMFPNLKKYGIQQHLNDKSIRASIGSKIFNGLVRLADNYVHLILKPGETIPLKKPLGLLFNPKWKEIRYDKAYIEKHADTLRDIFAPSEDVNNKIKTLFENTKSADVTIGVHIRRGDYKEFRGGVWYYENDIYREKMLMLRDEFSKEGKSVRFFISSNEDIVAEEFNGCDIFKNKNGSILTDLYGLASCDYIIGAPSTFSQWASFYGKRPLSHIMDKEQTMTIESFKTIISLLDLN